MFISYASEDREALARPLAEALCEHFDIWYDQYSLVMGDSLREKIDEGLSSCEFGIVILSKYFFGKSWPKKELDGLISRESSGHSVILPIWHNIEKDDVEKYSPILASKLAVKSSGNLKDIVKEIERAVNKRYERISQHKQEQSTTPGKNKKQFINGNNSPNTTENKTSDFKKPEKEIHRRYRRFDSQLAGESNSEYWDRVLGWWRGG